MRALALMALIALALAPAAAAAPLALTIEARESGCPSGHTYCFVVTQGSLGDLKAGAQGTITLQNKGAVPHEVKLVKVADADPAHQGTNEEKAFATSEEDLPGGQSNTFNFTVPADATGVYLFCGVSGHEKLGMWLDSTATAKGSPGFEMPMLLLALVAVAVVVGRRN